MRTIQDMSSTSTRRFNEADIRRSISRLLITHDLSWEEFIAKGEADELAELDGDLDFAYKALAAHIEPVQGAPTVKPAEAVEEFHRTYGLPVLDRPELVEERVELRLDLIREELAELVEAAEKLDLVGVADALGDLLYVIYGAAHEFGIPLDAVVAEIHRSNMTKLWTEEEAEEALRNPDRYPEDKRPHRAIRTAAGVVTQRADGKVLKGPRYQPPDIEAVLRRSR